MIMYLFGFQQGWSDASSKCSYLVSKEGDAAYDQQYFVLLKPKQLFFRTVHTTTSMDPAFLKDICISLLSNPLILKFKQSCVDFRPQNWLNRSSKFSNFRLGDPRSGISGFPEFQLTNL
jgi:hypothetical protein